MLTMKGMELGLHGHGEIPPDPTFPSSSRAWQTNNLPAIKPCGCLESVPGNPVEKGPVSSNGHYDVDILFFTIHAHGNDGKERDTDNPMYGGTSPYCPATTSEGIKEI